MKNFALGYIYLGCACWLILCIVLYSELFAGYNGVFTNVSSNVFQYIGQNEIETAINAHLENYDSLSRKYASIITLIGVGAIKCGSSYFHKSIKSIGLKQNIKNAKYQFIFGATNELHFERCADCSFAAYTQLFLSNTTERHVRLSANSNATRIFVEKTPRYFDSHKAVQLFTFYAHTSPIYFYVLLRDPRKQLWSHLWMRTKLCRERHKDIKLRCYFVRKENAHLNASKFADIDEMAVYLQDFIENKIDKQLPLVSKLMDLLKIHHDGYNANDNGDIDVFRVIALLKQISYDRLHYYSHVFIQSCFYCNLLLWSHLWEQWNTNERLSELQDKSNIVAFEERFRIIQSERIFESTQETHLTVTRLLCWALGDRPMDECTSKQLNKKYLHSQLNRFRNAKKYAPSMIDVRQLNVSNTIQAFYNDSQQRLKWFLQKHPKLILGEDSFIAWW